MSSSGSALQQQIGLARRGQHRLRIQAARVPRQRVRDVTADRIGGLGQESEPRAGQLGERLRKRMQLRRVRVLLGEIAEEHALALAAGEARGDRLAQRREGSIPESAAGTALPAAAAAQRRSRPARAAAPTARRSHLCAIVHQQSSSCRMQQRKLRALLGRLAQPLREQRMVLAQEAADDEHAVERGELGDRHAEPRRAVGSPQPAR